jgi:hypothetical protein
MPTASQSSPTQRHQLMSTVEPTLAAATLPPRNSGATTSTCAPSTAIFAAIRVPSGDSLGFTMVGSLAKVSTGTRSESVAVAFDVETCGAVCPATIWAATIWAAMIAGIIAPVSRPIRHVIGHVIDSLPPAIPQRPCAQSIAFGSRYKSGRYASGRRRSRLDRSGICRRANGLVIFREWIGNIREPGRTGSQGA